MKLDVNKIDKVKWCTASLYAYQTLYVSTLYVSKVKRSHGVRSKVNQILKRNKKNGKPKHAVHSVPPNGLD